MRSRILVLFLLALASGTSCAPRAAGGGARSTSDLITSDQMMSVNAQTAYEAVQRIQPNWLTTRAPVTLTNEVPEMASVYLGGNYMGSVEALHRFRAHDLEALRYYSPAEASARFGQGHERGVIDVILKGYDGV